MIRILRLSKLSVTCFLILCLGVDSALAIPPVVNPAVARKEKSAISMLAVLMTEFASQYRVRVNSHKLRVNLKETSVTTAQNHKSKKTEKFMVQYLKMSISL